jgi:hypothetical protein
VVISGTVTPDFRDLFVIELIRNFCCLYFFFLFRFTLLIQFSALLMHKASRLILLGDVFLIINRYKPNLFGISQYV